MSAKKRMLRGTALGAEIAGVLGNQMPDKNTLPSLNTRVTVRFSGSPAHYHLLEVYTPHGSAVVQIKGDCPRDIVAMLAAHVAGLGVC